MMPYQKIIEGYISKSVVAAIALVTLLLVGLQIFILFVNQLEDLGKGDYGMLQALMFVLMDLPYQVYLFFPMASLMGCLIGLGALANHHELVVMRSAGMSIGQITWAVLKVALILILLVTWVGETWVPLLSHKANDEKIQSVSGGQTLRTSKGLWLRYGNDFITVGEVTSGHRLEHVSQFHFDASQRLLWARELERVDYQADGTWKAFNVAETALQNTHTTPKHMDDMTWEVKLTPSFFNASRNEPDEMTLPALRQYITAQKTNHQSVVNYQFAFWQRLIQPLTTVVMMILAIPFIFGPLRSSTMGSKLLVGATVGFGFHILNRFAGPVSQVYQWPPLMAALGPTFCFAMIGLYLMRRMR